eukprot:166079_1
MRDSLALEIASDITVKDKDGCSPKSKCQKEDEQQLQSQQTMLVADAMETPSYEYEIDGAPWWMPIDDSIRYDSDHDASAKAKKTKNDNFKIVVDNPWLEYQANHPSQKRDKRKYLLSVDFQVNCRKYLLFTSLLLFIVVMTFICSVYTGFYELKGYAFNFIVGAILTYGIIIGFVCSDMNRYQTRTVLFALNVYWSLAWIVIIGLFITASIYLILFPSKFKSFCQKRMICDGDTESIIFAEMSLFCSLILYIFLMCFYIQRIANVVIVISNIRDYSLEFETNCFMNVCHTHMMRYLKGWKAFRYLISKRTGLRMSDVMYCSCWFRKCKRDSSKDWKPFDHKEKDSKKKRKKRKKKTKNDRDTEPCHMLEFSNNIQYEAQYEREECCGCWDSVRSRRNTTDINPHDNCCGDCLYSFCDFEDSLRGCWECLEEMMCRCDGCSCSNDDDDTDYRDCTVCYESLCNICGCKGCGECEDCDGGGEAVVFIGIAMVIAALCVLVFLLPVIVFACIAAPFWLFAQCLVWKLNRKVSWIVVVIIFILFLVPPCFIWAYLWTVICLGNIGNKFMTVMCLIWSFFRTIYSSFA